MSAAPLRLMAATLLIGVVAGVAILQLFPSSDSRDQSAVSPVEPVIVVQAPTSAVDQPTAATFGDEETPPTSVLSQTAVEGGVEFVDRTQLEDELPSAVVELLIERDAILVEEVSADVP